MNNEAWIETYEKVLLTFRLLSRTSDRWWVLHAHSHPACNENHTLGKMSMKGGPCVAPISLGIATTSAANHKSLEVTCNAWLFNPIAE